MPSDCSNILVIFKIDLGPHGFQLTLMRSHDAYELQQSKSKNEHNIMIR